MPSKSTLFLTPFSLSSETLILSKIDGGFITPVSEAARTILVCEKSPPSRTKGIGFFCGLVKTSSVVPNNNKLAKI